MALTTPEPRIEGWTLAGRKLRCGAQGRTEIGFRDHDAAQAEPFVIKRFGIHGRVDAGARRAAASEVAALSRIRHPCVIDMVDHGVDLAGTPFIALPYLRRGHLTVAALAAMPFERILVLLEQLQSALSVLHEQGVAHGDLAACNVLLAEDNSVVLIDFACATLKDDETTSADAWSRATGVDLQRLNVLCRWLCRQGLAPANDRAATVRRQLDEAFGALLLSDATVRRSNLAATYQALLARPPATATGGNSASRHLARPTIIRPSTMTPPSATLASHGLCIRSVAPLPDAARIAEPVAPTELEIVYGPTPASLGRGQVLHGFCEAAPDVALFHLPQGGRILAEAGRKITCDGFGATPPEALGEVIHKTVLPVILLQRRELLLHASAVVGGEKARLFCGPSGAGKSTTAAGLAKRGRSLIADDLCQLRRAEIGPPIVWPESAFPRLDEAARRHLDLEAPLDRLDAWKAPVKGLAKQEQPRPIGTLFVLHVDRGAREVRIQPMAPAAAKAILRRETHGLELITLMGLREEHEAWLDALVATTPIFGLRRSADFGVFEMMLDQLEMTWRDG